MNVFAVPQLSQTAGKQKVTQNRTVGGLGGAAVIKYYPDFWEAHTTIQGYDIIWLLLSAVADVRVGGPGRHRVTTVAVNLSNARLPCASGICQEYQNFS